MKYDTIEDGESTPLKEDGYTSAASSSTFSSSSSSFSSVATDADADGYIFERSLLVSIVVLVMINVIDVIAYSIVTPSLIFYVVELGGTKEQYGMILSSSFLSSLIMMPIYGKWIDSNGNHYLPAYNTSFVFGFLGAVLYFGARMVPTTAHHSSHYNWAVGMIFAGAFMNGMGAASRTLAYSYVATAIPRDQQRTTLTIMSMTRSFGMILGPIINAFVSNINNTFFVIGTSATSITIPIDRYNVVGLVLALGQVFLFILTNLFLLDPQEHHQQQNHHGVTVKTKSTTTNEDTPLLLVVACERSSSNNSSDDDNDDKGKEIMPPPAAPATNVRDAGFQEIINAILCFDICFPMVTMSVIFFSISLYRVTIPPVGNHALGWDPVQISDVLAVNSVVLFVGMCVSMVCSIKTLASDGMMIGFGNAGFIVGGTCTYLFWRTDTITEWKFVLPIFIVNFSYPFLGPANRSKFTKAVHARPELDNCHGIMQSFFNQGFMVAGLLAQTFVAACVLRSPDDIDDGGGGISSSASSTSPTNYHELTPWAWYVPLSSTVLIVGLLYEKYMYDGNTKKKKIELGWLR